MNNIVGADVLSMFLAQMCTECVWSAIGSRTQSAYIVACVGVRFAMSLQMIDILQFASTDVASCAAILANDNRSVDDRCTTR